MMTWRRLAAVVLCTTCFSVILAEECAWDTEFYGLGLSYQVRAFLFNIEEVVNVGFHLGDSKLFGKPFSDIISCRLAVFPWAHLAAKYCKKQFRIYDGGFVVSSTDLFGLCNGTQPAWDDFEPQARQNPILVSVVACPGKQWRLWKTLQFCICHHVPGDRTQIAQDEQ